MWWQNNSLPCVHASSAGSSACAARKQLFSHMQRHKDCSGEMWFYMCTHAHVCYEGEERRLVSSEHPILDKHATALPSIKPL